MKQNDDYSAGPAANEDGKGGYWVVIQCADLLAGKCIASQSKSTFFSISASSLTSKWASNLSTLVP